MTKKIELRWLDQLDQQDFTYRADWKCINIFVAYVDSYFRSNEKWLIIQKMILLNGK